jgi:transposase
MTESDSRGFVGGDSLAPKTRSIKYYASELKRRIVEETFAPGSSVSIVARRYDVNTNLVFAWRQKYRQGELGEGKFTRRTTSPSAEELVRVGMIDADCNLRPVPADGDSSVPSPSRIKRPSMRETGSIPATGIVEIELPNRVRVRVDGDITETALRRVLAVARDAA